MSKMSNFDYSYSSSCLSNNLGRASGEDSLNELIYCHQEISARNWTTYKSYERMKYL